MSGLGLAAIFCVLCEIDETRSRFDGIPLPENFQQLFNDWAEEKINFIGNSELRVRSGELF